MPVCKKCKKSFPNKMEIDGKLRTINKRKYCLECSPFGAHNTRKLDLIDSFLPKEKIIEQNCCTCNRKYSYYKGRIDGKRCRHTSKECMPCRVNRRRFALKKKMVDYKGGNCVFCGYSKSSSALIFHHTDPNEKDFNMGGKHCLAWGKIKAELDKCILLCSNCHAEEHERLESR